MFLEEIMEKVGPRKKLDTVKELARTLKISPRTIYNKLSNGTFPIKPIRIGRLLRFREEDISEYLNSL